jgi:SPP1 family predicted phage head-tail adaptor
MDEMPEAGDYTKRVTIQLKSIVKDSFGQDLDSWADVGTYWAMVKPLTGSNVIQGEWMKSLETHHIEMRYIIELNQTEHRLVYKGRVLRITSAVNVEERNYKYQIGATEVKSVGH